MKERFRVQGLGFRVKNDMSSGFVLPLAGIRPDPCRLSDDSLPSLVEDPPEVWMGGE
jgi:hypothetical protein